MSDDRWRKVRLTTSARTHSEPTAVAHVRGDADMRHHALRACATLLESDAAASAASELVDVPADLLRRLQPVLALVALPRSSVVADDRAGAAASASTLATPLLADDAAATLDVGLTTFDGCVAMIDGSAVLRQERDAFAASLLAPLLGEFDRIVDMSVGRYASFSCLAFTVCRRRQQRNGVVATRRTSATAADGGARVLAARNVGADWRARRDGRRRRALRRADDARRCATASEIAAVR